MGIRKKIKKIIILYIIFTLLISLSLFSYADDVEDYMDEEFDFETILTNAKIEKDVLINSRAAIIYDRNSKTVLWGKEQDTRKAMASTTKILTSMIVIENMNLNEKVKINKQAAGVGGSRLGLSLNDEITVKDLLYGLMLRSGNDAAVALAMHTAGSLDNFSIMMNEKIEKLGLKNSNFVTPHGLDNPEHYTTAYELAKITDYALENKTFRQIVNTQTAQIYINNQPRTINNTNELLGNVDGVYGVKTGFTNNAGRCLVSSVKRDNMDLIVVVLGADTKKFRAVDSTKLIEYAYSNYSVIDIGKIAQEEFNMWKSINQNRIIVEKGMLENVELYMNELKLDKMPIKNDEKDKIEVVISCMNYVKAPIQEKERLGTLSLRINEKVIIETEIVNRMEIKKKTTTDYMRVFLKEYVTIGSYSY